MVRSSSNSFIWLILLILIFFTDNSSNTTIGNYFKLTSPSSNIFNTFI